MPESVTQNVTKTFAHHTPSAEATSRIKGIREMYAALASHLDVTIPSGREKAIALTNLEQSAMWAIKGVILSDPNAIPEPFMSTLQTVAPVPLQEPPKKQDNDC